MVQPRSVETKRRPGRRRKRTLAIQATLRRPFQRNPLRSCDASSATRFAATPPAS